MKLFIWDFHGVLEKGNEDIVFKVTNMSLQRNAFSKRMSFQENIDLSGKKWFKYFEYLLPNESHETHLKLQQTCFDIEDENPDFQSTLIKANDYVLEVLKKISEKHQQILISNCHESVLPKYLSSVKIDKYFNHQNTFSTSASLYPEKVSKKEIFENYLKNNHNFDDFITTGDSPTDMEILEKGQGKRYLYAYPNRSFRNCESDYKIHDLREVLKEL
jgi:phosphoglycolate phosphatase-like HAD superfamily hydrolase